MKRISQFSCLDPKQQNRRGEFWPTADPFLFSLHLTGCVLNADADVATCILWLRIVPPCDQSASCRRSLKAARTVAPPGSCCTAEWEKREDRMNNYTVCFLKYISFGSEICYSYIRQWDIVGLTLLMLLGGGRWFGSLSFSTPSSQGNMSRHCFSLKRLSIGTTWPSVVKMYLLSDLWSGLSSSNSCNEWDTFLFYSHVS